LAELCGGIGGFSPSLRFILSISHCLTLRAFERQLHLLLEQKKRDEAMGRQGETDLEALSKRCPNVPIDPDLLALVGIHPENPVQDDKALIREFIARRIID
jgi:hypothetical protein